MHKEGGFGNPRKEPLEHVENAVEANHQVIVVLTNFDKKSFGL